MPLSNTKVAGALLLVGGAQFIILLIITEAVYPGYSVSANYISDLGVWGKPSAPVFNPSTMLFGATVLASAYFINKHFKNRIITVLFALAGAGALGVGIFPENTFIVNGVAVIHYISALLAFIGGGVTAIATYKITKPPFRYLSVILGAATLTAAVLFATTRDIGFLGIGAGGMERMMAYPTLLWIISLGGYLLGTTHEI
jgi:hypothetical membrane protein